MSWIDADSALTGVLADAYPADRDACSASIRNERKQLVEQAKALRRDGAGATEDATAAAATADAPADDARMTDGAKPTFAYAVDAKKARKAAKRRAKVRACEARYDGDVQKTP